jgi:uncharacterized membrane protein YdjX (TVP38/TMEM64 family)
VKKSAVLRPLLLLALLAAAVAAAVLLSAEQRRNELAGWLRDFLDWIRDLGWWGPLVYAVFYAVVALVIPGTIPSLGAGFAFGVVLGTAVVSSGSVTTAVIAFWLGRTLARGWVEAKVAASPKFRAIDQAVADNGFKIVLLTRLSPVFPFLLLNYAFGLTRVRFRDYFLATWLGMLPGTVLYVYLGSTLREVADIVTGNVGRTPAQTALFWAGLAAAVVVTVVITRSARQALRRALPADAEGATHD